MRLKITIDNLTHEIDSTDPELLSKWILEILGRVQWTPATYAYFQAMPTFIFDPNTNQYHADWTADSRIISTAESFRTPKQLLEALSYQLEKAELLAKGQ